jgi:DNA-binding NarL/FixJ family response regulator
VACQEVYLQESPVVLQGLQRFLGDQPGFEIVGVAEDSAEFLRLVAETKPDIAFVDLVLTRITEEGTHTSGLEVIEEVQRLAASSRCIVYSAYPEQARRRSGTVMSLCFTAFGGAVGVRRDIPSTSGHVSDVRSRS